MQRQCHNPRISERADPIYVYQRGEPAQKLLQPFGLSFIRGYKEFGPGPRPLNQFVVTALQFTMHFARRPQRTRLD